MALSNKGNFIIDGKEFRAKAIATSFDSLATEDSGRTDDGIMHINWIKDKLRKWEIEMPPCTADEAYRIISTVQGQIYYITIWDISTNSEVTVHVYTSNANGDCYSGVLYNGFYQGIRFSTIEIGD